MSRLQPSPESLRQKLIELLLERSVSRGQFTLSSGRESGYYIDARKTTMSAQGLHLVGNLGLAEIRRLGWKATAVGGLTLGADPVAYAIAAASVAVPPIVDSFTVRKEPKGHGTASQTEGCFEDGARVVVMEDVITSGESALKAVEVVRDAGALVYGVLAVVDRLEGGSQRIVDSGLDFTALVTVSDLGIG